MKLKIFNEATFPKSTQRSNGRPLLSVSKVGTLRFNREAKKLLQLDTGCKISICQDEAEKLNWYLFKDDKGFEIRDSYDKTGLICNHTALVKEIINCFGLAVESSHSFKIAGQPTKVKGCDITYWGLIAPIA